MPKADPSRPDCCRPPGWAWLALPLFAGLLLAGMHAHELWRDETQAWAVTRDSASLVELLGRSLRYEGHPPLWYVLLFPLTRLTHDPRAMQVLQALIAMGCAALILARAPFPRYQRVLLIFGYFPFYEWGVLSRNYALGLLALLAALALYPRRRERPVELALLLALMALSNAYSMIIAGAFAAVLIGELLQERASGRSPPGRGPERALALAVFLAGIGLALAYLIPPHDRWSGQTWSFGPKHLVGAAAAVWNGWMPLPKFTDYHFWNTNILTLGSANATLVARALPGAALGLLGLVLLRRRPVAQLFFALATAGILLLTYARWPGFLRHHGHFFLVFVAALWMAAHQSDSPRPWPAWPSRFDPGRLAPLILTVLALLHVTAAAWAFGMDLAWPFSDSRAAAHWIRERHLDRMPIVGSRDYLVSPLSTYLDRPIYYPEYGAWGGGWTARVHGHGYDPRLALDAARSLAARRGTPVLLVLSQPLPDAAGEEPRSPLAAFDRSFLKYDSGFSRLEPEFYYLYEIVPGDTAGSLRMGRPSTARDSELP